MQQTRATAAVTSVAIGLQAAVGGKLPVATLSIAAAANPAANMVRFFSL